MKAKVKETGEIVVVENLFDDGTALVKGSYIKISQLDFFDNIDWKQRRYEIAKEALTAIMSNSEYYRDIISEKKYERNNIIHIPTAISEEAVELADALIFELRKER